MKIMVLNSSGNVGKSTITALIAKKMQDTQIIEVETVNRGNAETKGLNVFKFNANENFEMVYEKIMMNENVIVDIGASSLGNFFDNISAYAGVEMIFDKFIIPTISDEKIQTDTFKTINFLRAMEISDDKIKVIFNRVKTTVENDFAPLLKAPFPFEKELCIRESSVFKEIGFLRVTIDELYNDDVNFYTSKMLKEKDKKQKAIFLKMDLTNKMIHKIKQNLDFVTSKIMS